MPFIGVRIQFLAQGVELAAIEVAVRKPALSVAGANERGVPQSHHRAFAKRLRNCLGAPPGFPGSGVTPEGRGKLRRATPHLPCRAVAAAPAGVAIVVPDMAEMRPTNLLKGEPRMTMPTMSLAELAKKGADVDLVR
jgi:hypothetical protein